MSGWKEILSRVVADADTAFDNLKYGIKERLNWYKPIQICAYRSFGSQEKVFVWGRVLENKGITPADDNDTVWQNIKNMYKRFESDEVPGVKLLVSFQGKEYITYSDHEGYFEVEIAPHTEIHEDMRWAEARVEMIGGPVKTDDVVFTYAQVLLPPTNADYGIISDIDDTVIESFATNKIKMFQTVFLKNSRTRVPFEGVSAFYKALQNGHDQQKHNPIFYVSSSPWNLYDFLMDFFDVHDIPVGPIMLRDTGVERGKLYAHDHRAHKYVQIERVLNTYPNLKFILIGDSGQKDALIYQEVIQHFPDRILAAYIRDVKLPTRAQIVLDIAETMKGDGQTVPMLLVENTVKAGEHAVAEGFISESWLEPIISTQQQDAAIEPEEEAVAKETPEKVLHEIEEELHDVDAKKAIEQGSKELHETENERRKQVNENFSKEKKPGA